MARAKTLLLISLVLLPLALWLLLPGLFAPASSEVPERLEQEASQEGAPLAPAAAKSAPAQKQAPFTGAGSPSSPSSPPQASSGIRGRVIDPLDVPVRGARILLYERLPGKPPREGRSDALGRFRLPAPPGSGYSLAVEHPEYASLPMLRYLDLPAEGLLELGSLRLQSGLSLRGRVALPSGAGLAGAVLELLPSLASAEGPFAPQARSSRSDSVGHFAFHGLADQPYELSVLPPPPWAEQRRTGLVADGAEIEVVLERGHRLRGRVLGPEGKPGAQALIRILPGEKQAPRELLSDAEGYFAAEGLLPGPCLVSARAHPAGAAVERELNLPHPAPLQLRLPSGTELRLRLASAGRPLPQSLSLLLSAAGQRQPISFGPLPIQGSLLRVQGLGPGDWRVALRVAGFAASEFELRLRGEPFVERSVQLDPGKTLRGRVLDAQGHPLTGLRLELRRPLPLGSRKLEVRRRLLAWTSSDAEGRFELSGLAAGPFELEGSLGRAPAQLLARGEVSASEKQELTLRWPPGDACLQLRLSNELPLPCQVILRPLHGGPPLRHCFVVSREHEWRGLAPGGYMVQRVGSQKAPELAQVSSGQSVSINLR
ncbi:MAG: hypothetical protein CSA62_11120 [Planctomycetota bacterium]|nr:MAG: hypothetical protein CSA62_11120 [Planctomycetota bacterium]